MNGVNTRVRTLALVLAVTAACGGGRPAASAPTTVEPNDDTIADEKRELKTLRASLQSAEQTLELTTRGRDAAVQAVTTDTGSSGKEPQFRVSVEEVREAASRRNELKAELARKQTKHERNYVIYERERRWLHGLGVSGSLAHAADGATIAGGSLRYLYRFLPEQTFELALGHHSEERGSDERPATTLRARLGFGREHALFFLGLGGGAIDLGQDARRYAALGEVGIVFRVGHHTRPGGSASAFADARLFAMPWLPFDGSSGSVLFGLELGAGVGGWNARKHQIERLQLPDDGK